MRPHGRDRKRYIDGRGEGMHEVGPLGVVQPQGGAALAAEIALARADHAVAAIVIADLGAIDANGLATLHRERAHVAHDVDGEAAAARRLAADAAVTEL